MRIDPRPTYGNPANLKVGATRARTPPCGTLPPAIPVARLELPERRQLYTPDNRTDNPR